MWSIGIKNRLDEIIETSNNDYVVFDCDNTIIMNDIKQTTDYFMLKNDLNRIDIDKYLEIYGKYDDYCFDKTQEIVSLYKKSVRNVDYLNSREYKDYFVKIYNLLWYIFKNHNTDIFETLYTDYDIKELKKICYKSFKYMSDIKFNKDDTISSDGEKINAIVGIKLVDDIKELMYKLNQKDIDIYIVTGSIEFFVKEYFYNFLPNEYNIKLPIKEIYGMYLKENENNKFVGLLDRDKIFTFREGKVQCIDERIYKKYNKGPLLVAGDSVGDYYMMTNYTDTKVNLIIDRNRTCLIQELIKNSDNYKYLVQYIDETKAEFIEKGPSITF